MNNLRGAVLMIVSMGIFAVQDLFIKQTSVTVPIGEILLVMGVFGALFYGWLVRAKRQRLVPKDLLHPAILLRNMSEVIATFGFVTALSLTEMTSAASILQALPLIVTMMAALGLGETVGWRRWCAISVGFLGMLLIVRPGTAGFEPNSLYAVMAVFAFGLRDLTTRIAPKSMSTIQIAQWGYIMMTLLGAVMVTLSDGFVAIPVDAMPQMLGIVVLGVAGYYIVVEALRMSDVSAVAPFRYSRLLFALALAVLFLGERPDLLTLAGASLIIGSGLYTLARERALFSQALQG
ncbi:DMT family transporter [Tropicimonas sp. TH_r6]|uniref:DMT family transporter n=1 Tax=Tropicimonas sp. TH_r6 TaxID=3082085 RepID=UPI002953BC03|nr:DMT family transporter [Tropicimonas sp. TH_r6]MDV7141543.1 DMT family transporter [Tropicimonas sp. TH_r6]